VQRIIAKGRPTIFTWGPSTFFIFLDGTT